MKLFGSVLSKLSKNKIIIFNIKKDIQRLLFFQRHSIVSNNYFFAEFVKHIKKDRGRYLIIYKLNNVLFVVSYFTQFSSNLTIKYNPLIQLSFYTSRATFRATLKTKKPVSHCL